MITEVDEPTFVQRTALRVSIFMNVFNVHVNRYPVVGTVRYVHYNPGKFLNAATEKSSLENEQTSVGIETASGTRILVRQIAGLIARRIVTVQPRRRAVEQGERMGIIRFGSRVDVFVPASATSRVKVGDTTIAGATVIARAGGPMKRARASRRPRSGAPSCCCRTVHAVQSVLRHLRDRRSRRAATSRRRRVHRARWRCRRARWTRRARDGHRQPVRRGARLAGRRDLVRARAGADHVLRGAQPRTAGTGSSSSSSRRAR